MNKGGRRAYAAVSVLAAGALCLTGCSKGGSKDNGNSAKDAKDAASQQKPISLGTAADSTGPAPEVPGARSGGVMHVVEQPAFDHLDPGQIYVSNLQQVSQLIHRGLTGFKATSNDGKEHKVVGDLATDPGTTNDGGKTWTFHLKDGIKWDDGTPITSEDARWSVERLFAPFINEGPTYLQQWLANTQGSDYRKLLPDGPYKGKHLPDSILETPDAKTIVFHFKSPHTDLPQALGIPGYALVEKKKDTKEKYDKNPATPGPYKIGKVDSGKSMTLVKNPNWDPKTDPLRHQYVDEFDIKFNQSYEASTKALIADTGDDKNTFSLDSPIDGGDLDTALADPKLKSRIVKGYQTYVAVLNINMARPEMQDKLVREAIAYAEPASPFVRAWGGDNAMQVAGGLLSPTVSGYDASDDPYGKVKKPGGDPAKAKALLKKAGKLGMKITLAYQNTKEGQSYSAAEAAALNKAGFNVQRQDIPQETYYSEISKINNKFDLIHTAWGADWPSAGTVIPPQFDGRTIQDGGTNYSQVNDDKLNKMIDEANALTDPAKASAAWEKVDKYILKDVIPAVPIAYYKQAQIVGSNVGGIVYDTVQSEIDPRRVFLKK